MTDLRLNGPSQPIAPNRPAQPRSGGTGPLPAASTPAPAAPPAPLVDNVRVVPQGSSIQALSWVEAPQMPQDPFATLSANFKVSDVDGLDQKSRGDLRGTLDADVSVRRSLLDYSVAQANQQYDNFDFKLEFDANTRQYKMPIELKAWPVDIPLGSIYIKPEGGQLKVSIGGLTGGAAKFANFLSLGQLRGVLDGVIQNMSKNMGFKVTGSSITDYTLEPDIQNSPLFKEMPLAGGEKLKLESVSSPAGSVVQINANANGDIGISMRNLDVVASSGPGGPQAVADREGADAMQIQARGQLNRDMSSDVATELDLTLNVTEAERAGLQQRIKGLTGQDLPVSGKVEVTDLKVQSHIQPNGQISNVESGGGTVKAEKLQLQLGPASANFDQIQGGLNLTRNGNVTNLETTDVSLRGSFSSPQGALQIQNLALSGTLRHDQSKPQDIRFELSPGKTLNFSGNLNQNGQQIGIQGLSVQNAALNAQLGAGKLQLQGVNGATPEASLQRISMPGTTLNNIKLTGTLNAELNTSRIDLDARSFSMSGTAGDIRLNSLSGSGKVHFDPAAGLQLEGATFRARGRAGDFGFTKLNGSGDMSVSPNGTVQLKQVNNLELVSDIGLSLNGSFRGSLAGQNVSLETTGNRAARMDFKPKDQPVQLTGLSLNGARLEGNLAQGNITLQSRQGGTLNASASSLKLPGIEMSQLRMRGGRLVTDIPNGRVRLESPADKPLDGSAGKVSLPGVELRQVSLKGNLEADTHSGNVSIDARSFSLQGTIGDLVINKLSGGGRASVSPTGAIRVDEGRNIELSTNIGLDLKGDFKGTVQGTSIDAETIGDNKASLDFVDPNGQLSLKGLQFQGHVTADLARQHITFAAGASGEARLSQGDIGGFKFNDVRLSQGTLSYTPEGLRVSPVEGGSFQAGGQFDEIKIERAESSGPVSYDIPTRTLKWDQPLTASLPQHGVSELRTEGPVSLQAMPSGEIIFSSQGGTINATVGALRLENLKTDGQVIYNPANGQLRFQGFDGKPLSVDGSFNGRPLKLESSGQIQIADVDGAYKITGSDIKVKGLVDGFSLDSPAGATGTISVKRDFSGFELNDLNFGFSVDDVNVAKGGGSVRSTPEGLEISLKGSLGADRGHLQALLGKLSAREDFGTSFQGTMNQVNGALDKAFADFQNANLNFENLTLKLNPNGTLRSFNIDNNSQLNNARLEMDLYGKKKVLPMGNVSWTAKVEGDAAQVRVPEGQLSFQLTPDLRRVMAEEVKAQLEASGLKKVNLSIEADGKIKIHNVTVGTQLIDVSARLELSTKIVNNQLEVSLDKMNLKNFLLDIVAKVANAPDKVADQVDQMLEQQKIHYERRNKKGTPDPESGRVFALDLKALVHRIDPNVTLKDASLDAQGNVRLDYSYTANLPGAAGR